MQINRVEKEIQRIILEIRLDVSIYHWAYKYPDRHDDDVSDKINVTLFSQEIFECCNAKFVGETLNCAVFDSGCTQTVCGKTWLRNYIDSLTDDDKVKVKVRKSDNHGNRLKLKKL